MEECWPRHRAASGASRDAKLYVAFSQAISWVSRPAVFEHCSTNGFRTLAAGMCSHVYSTKIDSATSPPWPRTPG